MSRYRPSHRVAIVTMPQEASEELAPTDDPILVLWDRITDNGDVRMFQHRLSVLHQGSIIKLALNNDPMPHYFRKWANRACTYCAQTFNLDPVVPQDQQDWHLCHATGLIESHSTPLSQSPALVRCIDTVSVIWTPDE